MEANEETPDNSASSGDKIRVGTRIIKQLSTTFYPNHLIIFDELVANARDALATKVAIDIQEDTITLEDNGEGMTRKGLVQFFYISHTGKLHSKIRSFNNVKRYIIGRFGIGKLSLYQICKKFHIETWRAGIVSTASFDFDKFEKEEFVDTFELDVSSESTERKGSGTKITLTNLKKLKNSIRPQFVKRHLMRTMPLTKDFEIVLSGIGLAHPITLESQQVVQGDMYVVEEDVPKIGRVNGYVIFKPTGTGDFGVFLRVFERLVNLDNPHTIINFPSLNHGRMFDRKIYADLNVNGLDSALQTNRAGFIVSDSKYISFIAWLKGKLNQLSDEQYKKWEKIRDHVEMNMMPEYVSEALSAAVMKSSLSSKPSRAISNHVLGSNTSRTLRRKEPTEKVRKSIRKFHPNKPREILSLLKGGNLKIEISAIGILEPEAVFDRTRKVLLINSSSPAYRFVKSQARLPGIVYHTFKAAVVLIALESSSSAFEFKETYDGLTRNPEILDMLRKRWGRMGSSENNRE